MNEHLPRLGQTFYRGHAVVDWVLTCKDRSTVGLDAEFHFRWREVMLHALVRENLLCPVYCLMPDHAHVIWMGTSGASDQQVAMRFLRTHTAKFLRAGAWQRQPFDHVLRGHERKQGAFMAACGYVLQNPVRKKFCTDWREYPYAGALFPRYPTLDPRHPDFWELFWKLRNERMAREAP